MRTPAHKEYHYIVCGDGHCDYREDNSFDQCKYWAEGGKCESAAVAQMIRREADA